VTGTALRMRPAQRRAPGGVVADRRRLGEFNWRCRLFGGRVGMTTCQPDQAVPVSDPPVCRDRLLNLTNNGAAGCG